jgi:hypothetical protein
MQTQFPPNTPTVIKLDVNLYGFYRERLLEDFKYHTAMFPYLPPMNTRGITNYVREQELIRATGFTDGFKWFLNNYNWLKSIGFTILPIDSQTFDQASRYICWKLETYHKGKNFTLNEEINDLLELHEKKRAKYGLELGIGHPQLEDIMKLYQRLHKQPTDEQEYQDRKKLYEILYENYDYSFPLK